MKRINIIFLLFASMLLMSGTTVINHDSMSKVGSASNNWYYLCLNGHYWDNENKAHNAAIITHVFYSSDKIYGCSDFMKWIDKNYKKNEFSYGYGKGVCKWSYSSENEAMKSRDERIKSLKSDRFKIIYCRYAGE